MIEQTKQKRIKGKIAEEQDRDKIRAPADAPDLAPVKNPRDSTSLAGGEGGADEVGVRGGMNVAVDN